MGTFLFFLNQGIKVSYFETGLWTLTQSLCMTLVFDSISQPKGLKLRSMTKPPFLKGWGSYRCSSSPSLLEASSGRTLNMSSSSSFLLYPVLNKGLSQLQTCMETIRSFVIVLFIIRAKNTHSFLN